MVAVDELKKKTTSVILDTSFHVTFEDIVFFTNVLSLIFFRFNSLKMKSKYI